MRGAARATITGRASRNLAEQVAPDLEPGEVLLHGLFVAHLGKQKGLGRFMGPVSLVLLATDRHLLLYRRRTLGYTRGRPIARFTYRQAEIARAPALAPGGLVIAGIPLQVQFSSGSGMTQDPGTFFAAITNDHQEATWPAERPLPEGVAVGTSPAGGHSTGLLDPTGLEPTRFARVSTRTFFYGFGGLMLLAVVMLIATSLLGR